MKKISVVIPSYNRQQTIERCLNSIENQTMAQHEYEIIVVDDASTDATNDIIDSFVKKNPAIKHIRLEKNSGGAALPRNVGMENAAGEFILFVDSDDFISESLLLDSYAFSVKENLDICLFRFTRTDTDDISREPSWVYPRIDLTSTGGLYGPWRLWRKSFLDNIGLKFNTRMKSEEDGLFFLMASFSTKNVGYLNDKPYYWLSRGEHFSHLVYLFSDIDIYKEIIDTTLSVISECFTEDDEYRCKLFCRYMHQNILPKLKNFCINADYDQDDLIKAFKDITLLFAGFNDNVFRYLSKNDAELFKNIRNGNVSEILKAIFRNGNTSEYINNLSRAKSDSVIVICVKDTPGSKHPAASNPLNKIGLATQFSECFRNSYVAVIDGGTLITEQRSHNMIRYTHECDKAWFDIRSGGFRAGNLASVRINGREFASNLRGFNVLIYSKKVNQVISSVAIDGYDGFRIKYQAL